ncbi:MAG: hypothetical protein NW701_05480 [Nitrospira sp.]
MGKLWVLIPLILLSCAACQSSASMRIDVEVYKGPLSKEPMVQFADLLGFLDEVKRGLEDMNDFTNAVALNKDFNNLLKTRPKASELEKGCQGSERKPLAKQFDFVCDTLKELETNKSLAELFDDSAARWCDGLDAEGAWDQIDYFDCIVLRKLRLSNDQLVLSIGTYKTDLERALEHRDRDRVEALLTGLSRFSGSMRKHPFSWTIPGTAGQTPNFKVRIAMVVYIVGTAEYGNQIHARIDALMKQLADGGYDRRELPLSVYISDTEPTDFVHLFDQWDAATDRSWAWPTVVAIDGTVKDRINMVKRLFADHHWSKINTAYASGWGKTKMAFIKDDIGNWNLKSFDNAPEELLNAYADFAKTTVEKAGKLAMDIHTGGSASTIESLIDLSRSMTMPSQGGGADSSAELITGLHNRAEVRLREMAYAAIVEEAKQTNPADRKPVRKRLIDSLSSILQDHRELVKISEKFVIR